MKLLNSRFGSFLLHNCRFFDVHINDPDQEYHPVVLWIDERNFVLAKFEDRADAVEYRRRMTEVISDFLTEKGNYEYLDLEEMHNDTMDQLSCWVPHHVGESVGD